MIQDNETTNNPGTPWQVKQADDSTHGGNNAKQPIDNATHPECNATPWQVSTPDGGIAGGNGIKPECADNPTLVLDSSTITPQDVTSH